MADLRGGIPHRHSPMTSYGLRLASHPRFQHGILAIIVANAILIGLETSPALWARYGGLFIAIVINNLEAAKREQSDAEPADTGAIVARLAGIRERLADIERDVQASARR